MKKLIYVILFSAFLGACKNQEVDFPDYTYNAVYFPVQYPVRTLSLGNDLIDNTLDKELTFKIGVCIGGMYENTKDWTVNYVVDTALARKLTNEKKDTLIVLPNKYIESISPIDVAIIPKGSFNGWITVKLKDAFLDDPIALTNRYVLPLRITGTNADSILSGLPIVANPDKRIASNWDANGLPLDFTLYGIKFANKIHGTYLHRGVDQVYDSTNTLISTTVFHKSYITEDQLIKLKSFGRNSVKTNSIGNTVSDDGKNGMLLTIDGSNNVTVAPVTGLVLLATGTGKYIEAANSNESWGNQKRDALYLDYQFTDATKKKHVVKDTIVFRDRGIVTEIQTVTVLP